MRALMCPPDFFEIRHKINAWMDKSRQPSVSLARVQWQQILKAYIDAGLEIWFIEPDPECQDMCFSANAAWCRWDKVLLANFRGLNGKIARVRQGEVRHYIEWFRKHSKTHPELEIIPFPESKIAFEGQGDVVTIHTDGSKSDAIVLVGFGQHRTSHAACNVIREVHNLERHQVVPMKLVSGYFYHLDTACVFIPPKTFLYYPKAFDEKGLSIIHGLPVDLVEASDEDAHNFVCNGVFIQDGRVFVANKVSKNLKENLSNRNIKVVEIHTTEFVKSGGSVRCLTLFLSQLTNKQKPL